MCFQKLFILFILLFFTSIKGKTQGEKSGLSLADFKVQANDNNDASALIQSAIDSASKIGCTLNIPPGIYNLKHTLYLKPGVTLHGSGMGSNALTKPFNGSVFFNKEADTILEIIGSNSGIDNMTFANAATNASCGIAMFAKNILIENVVLSRISIYGFTQGTALSFNAAENGGITYNSLYDVHIRNAKTGIAITQDSGSFVNSNSFYSCSVSGGGFDKGVFINGGDNNNFYGLVIEPYTSLTGHLVVKNGQINAENIRIEAVKQPAAIPVIYFEKNTSESVVNGFFAGGLVLDKGDNTIDLKSSNYASSEINTGNLFVNSSFLLPDSKGIPQFWRMSDSSAGITVEKEQLIRNQQILTLKIPPLHNCYLSPSSNIKSSLSPYSNLTSISIMVKSFIARSVILSSNSDHGIVSSLPCAGTGEWERLGLTAITKNTREIRPEIIFFNMNSHDTLTVQITDPSLSEDLHPTQISANIITGAGGIITGTLTLGLCNTFTYSPLDKTLTLPKNGNYFFIDSDKKMEIEKINYTASDQFTKGTVINLIFGFAGCTIQNNKYLLLKNKFTSSSKNTSLTLISKGNGSWLEVNRNN